MIIFDDIGLKGILTKIFLIMAFHFQASGHFPLPFFEEACDPETRPRELNASQPGIFRTEGWPNGTYPPDALCEWIIRQDEELVSF